MSAFRRPAQVLPVRTARSRLPRALALVALVAGGLALAPAGARAASPADEAAWRGAVERAVRARLAGADTHADGAAPGAGAPAAPAAIRVEIEVGAPDPRLASPPCATVEAFLPPGARLDAGRFSAGLRCAGADAAGRGWTAYLPVTLRRYARVAVAARDIAAGTPLAAADLAIEERELTRLGSAAVTDTAPLVGRSLTRAFPAGQPLLSSALRREPVVTPGEAVQVIVNGGGFTIRAEGIALDLAEAGQMVRVRLDNGQRVQGTARAGHLVELQL